jgi:hypothetical protein
LPRFFAGAAVKRYENAGVFSTALPESPADIHVRLVFILGRAGNKKF